MFSIVVPTYARPDRLTACLHALARLHYPRNCFEVLVVDDGSPTPPDATVTPFHAWLDITLLTQPHAGPATARNTGAARAKGQYLVFIDDDCAPAPDWLCALAVCFAAMPDCAVGGRTLNVLTDNSYSITSQILIDYLYAYYNPDRDLAHFLTSNNLAMPADRFHLVGGFDPTFPRAAAEDRDLCDRWLYHGYQMIYAPEVLVYHAHLLTFRAFWRQHFNYGRGAYSFHRARAQRGHRRIKVEPLSFYLYLLCYPFTQRRGQRPLLLAALLAMSQAANISGFWWEQVNYLSTISNVGRFVHKM